jgi:hypothetical protein
MVHCGQIAAVLLLASLARGQAVTAGLASDIDFGATSIDVSPSAPASALDEQAPFGVDDERFAQFLREEPDLGSSGSLGSSALSTILLGLGLLCAAGPLGRLISGLERPSRPRRADDPGP